MCSPANVSIESGRIAKFTYQSRCPLQIRLAHQPTNTSVSRGISDQESTIADVARSTRVVGLDVEATQTDLLPIASGSRHVLHFINTSLDVSKHHDSAKHTEPVGTEGFKW